MKPLEKVQYPYFYNIITKYVSEEGNWLDSIISNAYKDIGIKQKSHDHLFKNSWKTINTSFALKYEKPLKKCNILAIE